MTWKIGDRAICITPGSCMEGLEVVICSELKYGEIGGTVRSAASLHAAYHYNIDPGIPTGNEAKFWAAEPQNLISLPPANEKISWEDCIWKPKELIRV